VFLGFIIPGADDEESALPLAITDLDRSPAATQLIERLDATPLLEVEAMDAVEIDAAVQDQKVTAGLIIPAGYGEALETGRPAVLSFVRLQTSSGAQSVWQAIEAVLSESNAVALAAEAAAAQVAAATGSVVDDGLVESARSLVQV